VVVMMDSVAKLCHVINPVISRCNLAAHKHSILSQFGWRVFKLIPLAGICNTQNQKMSAA
jgi:hypothetical protein